MNKRMFLYVGSIFVLLIISVFPVSILMSPMMTPFEYLQTKPFIDIFGVTLIVPSSTLIVYLLGIITILIGMKLSHFDEKYKKYWGISLIIWGVGTLLAGTSYQGLGYELKCSNQDYCLFTSWFELSYLYGTALSITIMAFAVSIQSLNKKYLHKYNQIAIIGFVLYTVSLISGIFFEIKLLITYEWFLIFFLPYFISFMSINVGSNHQLKNPLDRGLILVWVFMLLINIAYFIYFLGGIGELIYENYGIWFSANDVLHIGLIGWMYYIYKVVKR
ncbi:MAG: hypothetical protein JXR62_00985 [Bacilli bacterium]|nr:hypothetical protein [Bacilli bacterium]